MLAGYSACQMLCLLDGRCSAVRFLGCLSDFDLLECVGQDSRKLCDFTAMSRVIGRKHTIFQNGQFFKF